MIFGKSSREGHSYPSVEELYKEALERLKREAAGYSIRLAEEIDLERVKEINYKCLPENYPFYFFKDLWSSWGKAFYVAVSPENDIVGYVMCRVEHKPGF